MSTEILLKPRIQLWRAAVCLTVGAYLALGAATHSIRFYHWFMLLSIPFALSSGKRGRRFFLDWAPLFAFWLVYDRLRLIQPLLYGRVAVDSPLLIEEWAFGWLTSGAAPAHAAHGWLSTDTGVLARSVEWSAQAVYFSHLFLVPLFILWLWFAAERGDQYRSLFLRFVRAFTLLNFSAIAIYLLVPVAPPWWVTLNGTERPTAEAVAQINIAGAMNGVLIQGMIRNASQWFAAVPSLHGAYPVLLLLLLPRERRFALTALALYGCAMWTATVVLNQHYIIDLVAGGALAIAAWWVEGLLKDRQESLTRRLPRVHRAPR